MRNKTLLYSSFLSLLVHMLLFSYISTFPHPWLHYTCVGTSIWNHGFTSKIAKWTDRAMITVCVGHNMYWLSMYNCHITSWIGMSLTINAVAFYFISKIVRNHYQIIFHFISHVCATFSNVLLGIVVVAKTTSCH